VSTDSEDDHANIIEFPARDDPKFVYTEADAKGMTFTIDGKKCTFAEMEQLVRARSETETPNSEGDPR
jgi:hypothetical protein